jgi:hypothetical protein
MDLPTSSWRSSKDCLRNFYLHFLELMASTTPTKLLACRPIKAGAGLAIPNPTATAENNWTSLAAICGHLMAALQGRQDYHSRDHTSIMAFGKAEVCKRSVEESEASMDVILHRLPSDRKSRTIRRERETQARGSLYPPLDRKWTLRSRVP